MTTLLLVRHGETDWNRDRRVQGTADIPLNDTGRQQARTAAVRLRAEMDPDSPAIVVSSTMSRARETAEIIAAQLGLDAPREFPDLHERAYGEAEGLTSTEIEERWGHWRLADVPGSESSADLRRRAIGALRRVAHDTRRRTAPVATSVIVVSHGALIREVVRHASGETLPLETDRLANGEGYTVQWEPDRLRLVTPPRVPA